MKVENIMVEGIHCVLYETESGWCIRPTRTLKLTARDCETRETAIRIATAAFQEEKKKK
jgi:hypothetical protein